MTCMNEEHGYLVQCNVASYMGLNKVFLWIMGKQSISTTSPFSVERNPPPSQLSAGLQQQLNPKNVRNRIARELNAIMWASLLQLMMHRDTLATIILTSGTLRLMMHIDALAIIILTSGTMMSYIISQALIVGEFLYWSVYFQQFHIIYWYNLCIIYKPGKATMRVVNEHLQVWRGCHRSHALELWDRAQV